MENKENLASEILSDYKKTNKRMFIIWIITFLALICSLCYTIYLNNDIGSVETTNEQEVSDIDSISGDIINGDSYGEN